ncbi:signal-regulatory protein beta-2-like isoform X2 [Thalassophryne amazonica]|uniref:signal-regulatory protein beta-2-like isoform X2 n=1 Tax=Thalassophryne amazonica TaxID=390379 RepID=UPI0014724172|nr:signal-regulatory protein beta-2-like isoform X2 [Thalassophryne amazonica]
MNWQPDMILAFCFALIFMCGRCTDDQSFVTKTVGVGEDVTLRCTRLTSVGGFLFWTRLIAGRFPVVLGATYTFNNSNVNKTPRIETKQEPRTFVLHITKVELSDAAFYYCEEQSELRKRRLNTTLLRVKGTEPNVTGVLQVIPSIRVHTGDSVTLQCSVIFDCKNQKCAGEHSVQWFRAESQCSHSSVIYADKNTGFCEKRTETQLCVYSFSRNISSSDAGTYYCVVTLCGEIVFGHGTNLGTEMESTRLTENTGVFVLCFALVISLIVIAGLVYAIKKETHQSCNDK